MILFAGAFGLGLLVLAWAADQFVVGSGRLAAALRVAPVFVGVVVIGFGTSAPELVVSGLAAVQGTPDLALGNAIGSNVANLTLVLGVAGVLGTVPVRSAVLRREAPLSVAAVVVFAVLVQAGLGRAEGVVLLVLLAGALWLMLRQARSDGPDVLAGEVAAYLDGGRHTVRLEVVRTTLGLAGTLLGAQLVVWGATGMAARLGVPPGAIGFTLVAVGTSLPELVTAVQAQRHGEPDLLVGNLLGSNIFNSLAVGGVVGLAGPGVVTGLALPVAVMVAASLATWLLLATPGGLQRWQAVLLLGSYLVVLPLIGQ